MEPQKVSPYEPGAAAHCLHCDRAESTVIWRGQRWSAVCLIEALADQTLTVWKTDRTDGGDSLRLQE